MNSNPLGVERQTSHPDAELQKRTSSNWDNFLKDKAELRKSIFHEKDLKLKELRQYNSQRTKNDLSSQDENEDDEDESSVDIKSEETFRRARPTIKGQQGMVVVCEALTDGVIQGDRPIGFPDLDYRLDLKTCLFSEREIQIIQNAISHQAHIICLSCVESADDVKEARSVLNAARGHHV